MDHCRRPDPTRPNPEETEPYARRHRRDHGDYNGACSTIRDSARGPFFIHLTQNRKARLTSAFLVAQGWADVPESKHSTRPHHRVGDGLVPDAPGCEEHPSEEELL